MDLGRSAIPAVCAIALALSVGVSHAGNHFGKPGLGRGASPAPGPLGGLGAGEGVIVDSAVTAAFTEMERAIIADYFTTHQIPARGLPPGIAKNLARGKPLPPGIAKRYLPYELQQELPMRTGYERVIVGHDVLLIEAATGLVADILIDMVRGQ